SRNSKSGGLARLGPRQERGRNLEPREKRWLQFHAAQHIGNQSDPLDGSGTSSAGARRVRRKVRAEARPRGGTSLRGVVQTESSGRELRRVPQTLGENH